MTARPAIPLTRRVLLQRAAQLSVLGAAAPLAMNLASLGEAAAMETSDYRALVCVFMYGGNDYSNTVVPYDQANHRRYQRIRGSIAFPRERLAATALTQQSPQTLTDDLQYALSPHMPRMANLFNTGKAAVQLNVGPLITPLTLANYESSNRALYPLPPKLFSHNDQQSVWQALGSEGSSIGWGGRLGDLAMESNQHALLTCISASGNAVFVSGQNALQYQISPSGAIKMNPIQDPQYGSEAISAALHQLVTQPREHAFENELTILARRSIEMEGIVNGALHGINVQAPFNPTDEANPLSDQLRIVARLIAARNALGSRRQIFFVSLDGFDHHNELLTKHEDLIGKVDEAIGAFYEATVALGVADKVTTFTASDFGRTLVNNSDGSDHGWGSHHFVVGGAVNGGRYYGAAPSVSINTEDQVGQGRLLPSTSIDQYAATLAQWFGVAPNELPGVLPNIGNFATPNLGFV